MNADTTPSAATPLSAALPADIAAALAMEKAMDTSIVVEGHPWAKGSYAAFVLAALFHDRPDPKASPSLKLELSATDYAPPGSASFLPPAQPALRLDKPADDAGTARPASVADAAAGVPSGAGDTQDTHAAQPDASAVAALVTETATSSANVPVAVPVEEGFLVSLRRSTLDKMPPVPALSLQGAATLAPDMASMSGASSATVAAPSDPDAPAVAPRLRAVALGAWGGLAAKDGRAAPNTPLAAAAFMTLWRVARETGLVRGGFLFHALHDPLREQAAEGEDVRLVWERTGPHVDQAVLQSEDGGAFSLLR